MYSIDFSIKAEKQFSKLNQKLKERIVKSLERIRIKPQSHIKKLVGVPFFSLRVGDYRVILDVNEGKLIILVIEMGYRKNVYK